MIIDTSVFVAWERTGTPIDFSPWRDEGETFISAITVSELLVGVHRATPVARRIKRSLFVESVIELMVCLDVTVEVARVHAELSTAQSAAGKIIGLHDTWIAATAIQHGLAVLTANVSDFSRVPHLRVIPLLPPANAAV